MKVKKIILITVALLLGVTCVGALFFTHVSSGLKHVENPSQLSPISPEVPPEQIEILKCIEEMNIRNAGILSLYCQDMDVIIQSGEIGIRLRGKMAYEKDKRFRMKIYRRFRNVLEADIGSNDSVFWFWASQMEPPALHYASHEDFLKTRLKKPFHPKSMMESFGINEIDIQDAELSEFEGKWKVSKKRKTGDGTVIHSILIDPVKKRHLGSYVTAEGKLVASSEVIEWEGDIPKVIILNWHDEGVILRLKLNDPKTNTSIPESQWAMPEINPKINMGD